MVASRRRRQKYEGNVPGLADLRAAAHRDLGVLDRVPFEWARFVTVIITAIKVKLTDDVATAVAAEIAKFAPAFRGCAMLNGFLKRGTRWAGVIEIDLAHPAFLKAQKRRLLQNFGIDDIAAHERVIIIHLHAVVDFRGHASPDVLMRDLRRAFPGPNRVDARAMHKDKTMTQNLERIADYCTKQMRAYSVWGEEDGGRTRFFNENEPEWRAWLDRLYTDIGLHNTLFSSVSSRAGDAPECPRAQAKTLMTQGFSALTRPEELIHLEDRDVCLEGTSVDTPQHSARIIKQRFQHIPEQLIEPCDINKPWVFYMMNRIMQRTIDTRYQGNPSSKPKLE